METKEIIEIAKTYAAVGPTALAKKLGVSKQRVQQLASSLRRDKIKIGRFRDKSGTRGNYNEALKLLKKGKSK